MGISFISFILCAFKCLKNASVSDSVYWQSQVAITKMRVVTDVLERDVARPIA